MAAVQGSMHWSRLFTRMLNAEVKLVGPTITCSNPATVSINDTMPYVQFYALATDKVSFHLVLNFVLTFTLCTHETCCQVCLCLASPT